MIRDNNLTASGKGLMVGGSGLAFLCWEMKYYLCTKNPFRESSDNTDIHEMVHQDHSLSQHDLRVTRLEPYRKPCVQRANTTRNS